LNYINAQSLIGRITITEIKNNHSKGKYTRKSMADGYKLGQPIKYKRKSVLARNNHESRLSAKMTRQVQVLQFTDLHLVCDPEQELWGVNTYRQFTRAVQEAIAQYSRTDLVLLTGDLVHDPQIEAYRLLQGYVAQLPFPIYRIPGNHDDPRLIDKCLSEGNLRSETTIRIGSWQIILLDSNAPAPAGGRLDKNQLQRLEEALSAYPDHYSLVCLHHHPVPIKSPWMDAMALVNPEEFFQVLDRHPQVQAVIWGHIHQEFDSRRQGVRLLGTPSTSTQFVPYCDHFQKDDLGPGFRWLLLHPDGRLETRVHYIATD
jgi:Icc protein